MGIMQGNGESEMLRREDAKMEKKKMRLQKKQGGKYVALCLNPTKKMF